MHTTIKQKDITSELVLAILSKVKDRKQTEISFKGRVLFPPENYKSQIQLVVKLLPPSSQFSTYIRKRYRDRYVFNNKHLFATFLLSLFYLVCIRFTGTIL